MLLCFIFKYASIKIMKDRIGLIADEITKVYMDHGQ